MPLDVENTMKEYDIEQVKSFLVEYNGLQKRTDFNSFCNSLHTSLRSIQFDPLNIVGRNADLFLNARISEYRKDNIKTKLYSEKTLVDGWDKMMSVYSMKDWKKLQRIREYKKHECKLIMSRRGVLDCLNYIDIVKNELASARGLQGKDIDLGRKESGSWCQKRTTSIILDYLFMIGEVGIKDKVNNQKIYDLIERIIPEEILYEKDFENDFAYYQWFVRRRIASIGVLWNKKSVLWQSIGDEFYDNSFRDNIFQTLLNEGRISAIRVKSIDRPLYIATEHVTRLEASGNTESAREVRFLAPLDNMIWEREQTKTIFGFEFSWEVYMPVDKRKYGYYVLPILYGNDFIGRIEPVMDKEQSRLVIKNIWLERAMNDELHDALVKEIENFARYMNCDTYEFNPASVS